MKPTAPRRNLWIAFFLILLALGVVAIVLPIVYNLGLQLKPENVMRARKLWAENGPRDYDLEMMRREDQQENADEYRVRVRGGRITAVIGKTEGVILVDETVGLALGPVIRVEPVEDLSRFTIEGLFDDIERQVREDQTSRGRRNYATASFDARDGHPHRYVHRVAGTKKRLEWIIKLTPVKE